MPQTSRDHKSFGEFPYLYISLLFLFKIGKQFLTVAFDLRLRVEDNGGYRPLQAMQCSKDRGLQSTFTLKTLHWFRESTRREAAQLAARLAALMRMSHP